MPNYLRRSKVAEKLTLKREQRDLEDLKRLLHIAIAKEIENERQRGSKQVRCVAL